MRIGEKKKKARNPKRILRPDETIPVRVPVPVKIPVKVPVPKEVNVGAE